MENSGTCSITRVTLEPTSVVEAVDGVQLGAWSSCCIQQQLTGNSHAERLLQTQLCAQEYTTDDVPLEARSDIFGVFEGTRAGETG